MPDDPSKFCEIMDAWAQACMTELPTDDDHKKEWRKKFREAWQFIRLSIRKSCLLDRLMYGGETLRTVPCPVHKGRWSGCSVDPQPDGCNCRHDICLTGWQQNPEDPKSGNSAMMVVTAVPNPETGHLTAVSKVNPPEAR